MFYFGLLKSTALWLAGGFLACVFALDVPLAEMSDSLRNPDGVPGGLYAAVVYGSIAYPGLVLFHVALLKWRWRNYAPWLKSKLGSPLRGIPASFWADITNPFRGLWAVRLLRRSFADTGYRASERHYYYLDKLEVLTHFVWAVVFWLSTASVSTYFAASS